MSTTLFFFLVKMSTTLEETKVFIYFYLVLRMGLEIFLISVNKLQFIKNIKICFLRKLVDTNTSCFLH